MDKNVGTMTSVWIRPQPSVDWTINKVMLYYKTFFLVTYIVENIDTAICSSSSRNSLSGYQFREVHQVVVSVQK